MPLLGVNNYQLISFRKLWVKHTKLSVTYHCKKMLKLINDPCSQPKIQNIYTVSGTSLQTIQSTNVDVGSSWDKHLSKVVTAPPNANMYSLWSSPIKYNVKYFKNVPSTDSSCKQYRWCSGSWRRMRCSSGASRSLPVTWTDAWRRSKRLAQCTLRPDSIAEISWPMFLYP
jgi:hypothetical protein